jgi:MazG family protein
MAEEAGHFRFDDVVEAICDKMERRHPHVFGDASIGSAEEQSRAWEQHKSAERAHHDSVLDGVALALPALVRAEKLQRRAARLGFDWPDIDGPLAKCHEEIAEIEQALKMQDQSEIESEIGDLLFSVVNLARFAAVDPEEALRRSSLTFTHRFRHVEQAVKAGGRAMNAMSLEELDALWEQAKQRLAQEAE